MIIRYTPAARDDLVQTKEYIETVLKNTIAAQLVIRVPVAYFFAKVLNFGFYGAAAAWIIAPIFSNTVYTIYLKSGKWYERLKNNQKNGHSI